MTKLPKGRGAQSDGADTNALTAPTRQLSGATQTLIIYFSRSGNTELQARLAQRLTAADIYELVAAQPYPANYQASVARATQEREAENWPALVAADLPDLTPYHTILLGHPIWAMTPANPMRQFLETFGDQLAGKRIASFSTNAGYGAGDTQQVLHQLTPALTVVLPNYTVHDGQLEKTTDVFERWVLRTVGR